MSGNYRKIIDVVRRIPRGRVATYGQVAGLAGLPRHARQVGCALQSLPDDETVPWQRVVNASGGVSPRCHPYAVPQQRRLLEREGVVFGSNDKISLSRFQWRPRR